MINALEQLQSGRVACTRIVDFIVAATVASVEPDKLMGDQQAACQDNHNSTASSNPDKPQKEAPPATHSDCAEVTGSCNVPGDELPLLVQLKDAAFAWHRPAGSVLPAPPQKPTAWLDSIQRAASAWLPCMREASKKTNPLHGTQNEAITPTGARREALEGVSPA